MFGVWTVAKQSGTVTAVRLISAQLLADIMAKRGESNRSLAEQANAATASIAHLRRGARDYCHPATAIKIETILHVPPGSLFLDEPSAVSTNSTQRTA